MPVVLLILLNIALAYFIGFLGRNRKMGFWGHFFASLLLTPVIGMLLIVATNPVTDKEELDSLKEKVKSLKSKLKSGGDEIKNK